MNQNLATEQIFCTKITVKLLIRNIGISRAQLLSNVSEVFQKKNTRTLSPTLQQYVYTVLFVDINICIKPNSRLFTNVVKSNLQTTSSNGMMEIESIYHICCTQTFVRRHESTRNARYIKTIINLRKKLTPYDTFIEFG